MTEIVSKKLGRQSAHRSAQGRPTGRPTRLPRVLVWDIESTGLNATFGSILCIGWKWLGDPTVTVRTIMAAGGSGMMDDKPLVREFAKAFAECDYHVTWYGLRFDLPMVMTKLLKYRLPPLPPKPHLDLWRTARYKMKLHSNRLATVSEYLGVPHSKTPITFDDWLNAAHGDKKSLSRVVEHCRLDVLVLEDVYERMLPWVAEQPHVGMLTGEPNGCPSCGSLRTTMQGTRVTKARKYQQYQCQDCGTWSRARIAEKSSPALVRAG